MTVEGFKDISISKALVRNDRGEGVEWWCHIRFYHPISDLFPVILDRIKRSRQCCRPPHVHFAYDGIQCTLYPEEALAAPFGSQARVFQFLKGFADFLNTLYDSGNCPARKPNSNRTRIRAARPPMPSDNKNGSAYVSFPMIGEDGTVTSTLSIEHTSIFNHRVLNEKSANSFSQYVASVNLPCPGNTLPCDKNGIKIQNGLTNRETEVLRLMADGYSNPDISKKLDISPHTVKAHVIHIFNKLNVNDRTQASVWAVQNHLI